MEPVIALAGQTRVQAVQPLEAVLAQAVQALQPVLAQLAMTALLQPQPLEAVPAQLQVFCAQAQQFFLQATPQAVTVVQPFRQGVQVLDALAAVQAALQAQRSQAIRNSLR